MRDAQYCLKCAEVALGMARNSASPAIEACVKMADSWMVMAQFAIDHPELVDD